MMDRVLASIPMNDQGRTRRLVCNPRELLKELEWMIIAIPEGAEITINLESAGVSFEHRREGRGSSEHQKSQTIGRPL
jgi:hypothetical protein